MATAPTFTSTPRLRSVTVSVANVNRDGTGTLVDLIGGVAAGTRVFEITVTATGTTTAGMVRLFLYDGSTRLFDEFPVVAVTVSASVAGARTTKTYQNLILPDTFSVIKASTHNAETFTVTAMASDLT